MYIYMYIYIQNFDLKSLADRRWYKKITFSYKIARNVAHKYLQSYLLHQALNQYSARVAMKNLLRILSSRTLSFSNIFFPYCINKRSKLNDNLRNATSIYKFKNYLTKFIRIKWNSTFSMSDPLGLKLLTRLRLNLSHLNKHKFWHNFRDNVNPMCSYRAGIETNDHQLLCC